MNLPKLVKSHPIYAFKFNQKRRLCVKCGTMYKPKSANSKYCSDRCRQLATGESTKRANMKAKKRRAMYVSN